MMLADLPPAGESVATRPGSPLPEFSGYHSLWLESGTGALALALLHARSQRPWATVPEVLLPAYGCPDLVAASIYAGMKPVLIDIGRDDPGYDLSTLKRYADQHRRPENIVAIVAVNFLGIRERLAELRELMPGAALVEDNAQWHPESELNGDYVITSFGRGKPAGVLGGGLLLVRDGLDLHPDWVRDRIGPARESPRFSAFSILVYRTKVVAYNILRRPPLYFWLNRNPLLRLGDTRFEALESIGRMPAAQQALVGANRQRHLAASRWREVCYDRGVGTIPGLKSIPVAAESRRGRLLRYPVLLESREQRDSLASTLSRRGLGSSVMYCQALHEIEGVGSRVVLPQPVPNASAFAQRLLTLPLHSGVRLGHIERIVALCEKGSGADQAEADMATSGGTLAKSRSSGQR